MQSLPNDGLAQRVRPGQLAAQLQPLRRRWVGACIPLVTEPIGTSSGSNPPTAR